MVAAEQLQTAPVSCLQSFFPLTVSTGQLNVYVQPPSAPTLPPVVTSAPRPPVTIQEVNSSGPIIIAPEQQAKPAPLGAPLVAPVASPPAEVSSDAVHLSDGWHRGGLHQLAHPASLKT